MAVIDIFPCGICHKKIPAHGKLVYCNHCNFWVHIRCNNSSNSEYEELQKDPDDVPWFCLKCTAVMLFKGKGKVKGIWALWIMKNYLT